MFIGTQGEFNTFVGPRIRNLVQRKTYGAKKKQNKCSGCRQDAELQAAHARETRLDLIARVLKPYLVGAIITCDLKEAEAAFWLEHDSDSFVFLCEPCHKAFDKFHAVVRGTSASLCIKDTEYHEWCPANNTPCHLGVYECVDGGPPEMLSVVGHGYRKWTPHGWSKSFSSVIDAGEEPVTASACCPKYWRGLTRKIAFPSD